MKIFNLFSAKPGFVLCCLILHISFFVKAHTNNFIGPPEECTYENEWDLEEEDFEEISVNTTATEDDDSLKRNFTPINIDTSFTNQNNNIPLPSIIEESVEYDPITNQYILTQTIGNSFFSNPKYLSLEEYLEYELDKSKYEFWDEKVEESAGIVNTLKDKLKDKLTNKAKGLLPEMYVGGEMFDRLFGGSTVDIRPQGNVNLDFGGQWSSTDRPDISEDLRSNGNFDFKMDINMNMLGQIGDKMKLDFNYNTLSNFDFDNNIKLDYAGTEDEIIQKIEAGNVSMPLPTLLIPGSQTLFGLKSKLKFGRMTVTSIASSQRSQNKSLTIEGGAQKENFEVWADQYEENRHFFLGHNFRDNFNQSLALLPYINSPYQINNIEVWVTNDQRDVSDVRNIVALMDLGEKKPFNENIVAGNNANNRYPDLDNNTNDLYNNIWQDSTARDLNSVTNKLNDLELTNGLDYIVTFARKLNSSEYTLNPQLGFVSLNINLQPDQVVAVSYEYTKNVDPDGLFKVGEFAGRLGPNSNEPNVIFTKMLKAQTQSPTIPLWDLMMKNVYSLGAYQVENDDFRLDLYYQDPGGGAKRYLPSEDRSVKGKPVIQLVNLDNLNANNERVVCEEFDDEGNLVNVGTGDGVFDFVEGLTIYKQRGRLMFPVLEPFGTDLKKQFRDKIEANKYTFQQLYDSTKTVALQVPKNNRYIIRGTYKSKLTSNIRLNAFNLPPGSVTVRQGGQILREDVDYQVNYSLGTLQLLNDSYLQSGLPIQVSYESPDLIGFNLKSLYGTRLDYWVNDDFSLGGTFMHLSERPFTPKVNYGDDPISNSMMGLDLNYFSEAPGITKFIDKIPFINTKEKSTISIRAEAARFAPGHSRAITKAGQVFIDDFEGSTTFNDVSFPFTSWRLASTPFGATDDFGNPLFPEAKYSDSLAYGYNRANINWYQLETNAFCGSGNNTIPNFVDECGNDYVREVSQLEIFPLRDLPQNQRQRTRTFDLSYYPSEKGPYNYNVDDLNDNGTLKRPQDRWGGIMRSLRNGSNTDFEASNTEFIDFWMMDPFIQDVDNPVDESQLGGSLYFNLGEVSEDILKDNLKFGEHSIDINNSSSIGTSSWGEVPLNQISNTFGLSTNPTERTAQDVGLDGLNDEDERDFFKNYVDAVNTSSLNQEVKDRLIADPSNDNYNHFRDEEVQGGKILDTYKNFNNTEGNSPVNSNNNRFRTTFPYSDMEDLNEDNTLNTNEAYFEYRLDLFPGMDIGDSFINNVQTASVNLPGGGTREVKWYNFKIPIQEYSGKVGPISDFRSIRFMRMFLTDFNVPTTLRFEGINLVRNQWRRYLYNLKEPGEIEVSDSYQDATFNVTSVSLEEHASRTPIPYVLPLGIEQEQILSSFGNNVLQNEQAMSVQVCGLVDGDARAVFKTLNYDFREFRRLNLVVHAEEGLNSTNELNDGDVTAFIRIGADFTQNYYEYEVPLKITKPENLPTDATNVEARVRELIWPEQNTIDLVLDSLINVKRNRNVSGFPNLRRYTEKRVHKIITDTLTQERDTIFSNISVVGTPDLGIVRTIMLGIRNPDKDSKSNIKGDEDDGLEKCTEVWFNEFALSEFDESDGYAAIATVDMKLADWGSLVLSGNMHTDGFGTLEQKVNDRFKDTYYEYDGALNLELGKFFPKESGIKIPFRADYSRSISDPEFDPYETDIRFDDSVNDEFKKTLNETGGDELIAEKARKKYRKDGRTVNEIKSVNLTNVRKVKTNNEKKARIYDIENWNATYAYTEQNYRDPIIESEKEKTHFGSIGYNYSLQPKFITPFKKLIKSDSKWLSLIKDFNFNPVPNTLSFRTDVNRTFAVTKLRDLIGDVDIKPTYNKNFIWGRNYNLRYDLSKTLSIDYNAANSAKIDEPCGAIDCQEKKDSLRRSIMSLGRNIDFRQGVNVRYKLPLDKIPLTDWIDVKAQYSNTYNWQVGPFAVIDTINLGNTISNTRDLELKGDFKLRNLYNKIPFLKQLDGRGRSIAPKRKKDKNKDGPKELVEKEEAVPKGDNKAVKSIFRVLTGVKQVSITYRDNRSTSLPGFLDSPEFFGQNFDNSAPGLDFVFGRQPNLNSWLPNIANKGWITPDTTLNFQVLQNQTQKIDFRATLEPLPDLKIDLNATMSYSRNHSEWFKKIDSFSDFQTLNPIDLGSYSISYVPVKTLFKSVKKDSTFVSEVFDQFEDNRTTIAQRLATEGGFSNGEFTAPFDSINAENYFEGYGPYAQDVLIPAFMAAYTGQDVRSAKTNPFTYIPIPNWRLTYNGLNKIGNLREVISNFSIKHGYNSTFTVNNYRTNQNFEGEVTQQGQGTYFKDGKFLRRDYGYGDLIDSLSGNFYSLYDIPAIVLTESFSPLIGCDITLKNGLTTTIDYKKSRNLALSFIDYQLIETRSDAFTFGLGYRFQEIDLELNLFGKNIVLKNDLNFLFDFTYRNDITLNYRVDRDKIEPTQGAVSYSISPRLDYVVNDRLNASLYYERMFTSPHTPNNFANANTRAGLRLTFTLAQ